MLARLVPLLAAAVLAGCGGDEAAEDATPPENGPIHVHGLGVDPADGALYVATHSGLWRSGPDERTARRVGDSRQDTMGFTVVGARSFLGSGHPDLREMREQSLPPHLGLIASDDAGASWRHVSLLGEADFHVLRAAGRTVYGWDATNARLLVSADGGESWDELPAPGQVFDLAPSPLAPGRVVAATGQGLYSSSDGGRTWSQLAAQLGLLAWPRGDALYLVTDSGLVFVSGDGGATWARRGDLGGTPAAFAAGADGRLYAALHEGPIKASIDGARWSVRVRG